MPNAANTPNGQQALPLGEERLFAVLVPAFVALAAGADPDLPAATASAGRITAVTAPARLAGVHRGQRLRDAQRTVPHLRVYPHDEQKAARAFEPVAAALEAVTVGVEIVRPGLILLRAAGPARYYGGEARAAAVLRDAVAEVHLDPERGPLGAGVGVASGPVAAALAAAGDHLIAPEDTGRFLARFDLSVLGRANLARVLRALGIRTLGELAALPADAVAARFGAEGVAAHRLARGLPARPLAPRRPRPGLAVSASFDPPRTLLEPLVFAAKTLADTLHAHLAEAGLTCDRVTITARTGDGREHTRTWRHDGALSSLALAERARWQLLGHADAARGAESEGEDDPDPDGFAALTLRPDGLRINPGRQTTLLGPAQLPDRADDAVERLQLLLGHGAVTRPVRTGGRDPGERIARVPFGDTLPEPRGDGPWPGRIPDPAPAAVLAEPAPADLLDEHGAPLAVSARGELSAAPRLLRLADGRDQRIVTYSTAWVAHERPWDPDTARRRARLQVTTADGHGFLLAVAHGAWSVLAAYQ